MDERSDTPIIMHDIEALLKKACNLAGASGYVVGVSGGVDSALAAALCTKAVGHENVRGFFLPSDLTPPEDAIDAKNLSDTYGFHLETIPIGPIINAYKEMPGFVESPYLLGNLMARTRMAILYYHANRENMLVCGTSNRTEYLLGYCTKFGDNAADIQPIIHLLKKDIWKLAKIAGVPNEIINRPPTAGLWHNQTDEDELGLSYNEIDEAILLMQDHSWKAENDVQRKVLERMHRYSHKREPVHQIKL